MLNVEMCLHSGLQTCKQKDIHINALMYRFDESHCRTLPGDGSGAPMLKYPHWKDNIIIAV